MKKADWLVGLCGACLGLVVMFWQGDSGAVSGAFYGATGGIVADGIYRVVRYFMGKDNSAFSGRRWETPPGQGE